MSNTVHSPTSPNLLVAASAFDPSALTTSIEIAPGQVLSVPTSLLLESLSAHMSSRSVAEGSAVAGAQGEIVIPVIAEELVVTKRVVPLETVRLTKTSEKAVDTAEVDLVQERWEVTKVPRDAEVSQRSEMRVEGETSIYPVFEERLVARKALFLTEEIYVRKIVETRRETVEAEVQRDIVTVERSAC